MLQFRNVETRTTDFTRYLTPEKNKKLHQDFDCWTYEVDRKKQEASNFNCIAQQQGNSSCLTSVDKIKVATKA